MTKRDTEAVGFPTTREEAVRQAELASTRHIRVVEKVARALEILEASTAQQDLRLEPAAQLKLVHCAIAGLHTLVCHDLIAFAGAYERVGWFDTPGPINAARPRQH